MTKSIKERFIESLRSSKLVSEEKLAKALESHRKEGVNLGQILVKEGVLTQKELMIFLSQEFSIPPIDLAKYKPDPAIAKLLPEKISKRYSLIAISKLGDTITVAIADPLNIFALDDIKLLTSCNIESVIATEDSISAAIAKSYGEKKFDADAMFEGAEREDIEVIGDESVDEENVTAESRKAPIVKVVNLIIEEALRKRASDIHIEPFEKEMKVRYRVDGDLQTALALPKKNQNAILARIKIMSRLDITETRMPQDGRFKMQFEGRSIDFRVSVLPVNHGGKIVLRVLDKSSLKTGIDGLGFSQYSLNVFKTALARPYGMTLITGPTGSGKSTTLYSIISQINKPEINIITLEDPVEYNLDGITQIQARAEIGLTFASGLKSILRQSPDVIMVGEIRDFETADIAIKASLTGHMLFSTLHTNDAPGAITRLIDMGVEPFLISSSLVMVGAQRLVRKTCAHCKVEDEVPDDVRKRLALKEGTKKAKFYKGKGCENCNGTGYYGRKAILEALLIDDKMRDMIVKRVSLDDLRAYAIRQGMLTLRDCAVEGLIEGTVSLEEVLRVTVEG
ncbi:MAG: ATPase, T2SS/T4P/T4SS family [Candidatus Omnitrophota bacterium]